MMENNRYLLLCDCCLPEHQLIFQYFSETEDDWDNRLYIDVHLTTYNNFFRRLINAVRYLFGYKSKYGEFDEMVVDVGEVQNLIDYLLNFTEKKTDIRHE